MDTNDNKESGENITKTTITETESCRTKQMFDVDLTEGYFNLEKILKNVTLKPGAIPADEYLRRSREMIEVVMNDQGRKMPERLNGSDYVIVDSSAPNYVGALGFVLISYNPVKMPLLLDYQKQHYQGKFVFEEIVSRTVLNYVLINSPFENDFRAVIIREWARKSQIVLSVPTQELEKKERVKPHVTAFSAYMRKPNPALLSVLKEKTKGIKGYKFITLIRALIKLQIIDQGTILSVREFHESCVHQFGAIGGKTAFNTNFKDLISDRSTRPKEEKEWIAVIQDFLESQETNPVSGQALQTGSPG